MKNKQERANQKLRKQLSKTALDCSSVFEMLRAIRRICQSDENFLNYCKQILDKQN
jgi:hypothetical protein